MASLSTKISHPEFAFKRGFMQIQQKDITRCKDEIMTVLGITTRATWLNRLNGRVEPKMSEITGIESVFSRYGITDIWGLS